MTYSIERTDDPAIAKQWWEHLNPRTSAFDDWSFRDCLYRHTGSKLLFLSAQHQGNPVALLPLQRGKANGSWEPFGGAIMEDNTMFADKNAHGAVEELLASAVEQFCLQYCRDLSHITLPHGYAVRAHGEKFILNLAALKTFDGFFQLFSSRSRAQLKKKLEEIDARTIQVISNRSADVQTLIDFNVGHFGEQSYFQMLGRKDAFRELAALPVTELLSFEVDGVLQGVSLCIHANGCLAYLNSGVQWEVVANLGTYVIVKNIERAFTLGCRLFDAGASPFNWKERMHLERVAIWELKKAQSSVR